VSRWRKPRPYLYTEIMSEEIDGHDSPSRLDRLEKIVEVLAHVQVDMQQIQRVLLSSQVLMSEEIRTMTARFNALNEKTDERFKALAEAQTAMMRTIDQLIRRQP